MMRYSPLLRRHPVLLVSLRNSFACRANARYAVWMVTGLLSLHCFKRPPHTVRTSRNRTSKLRSLYSLIATRVTAPGLVMTANLGPFPEGG